MLETSKASRQLFCAENKPRWPSSLVLLPGFASPYIFPTDSLRIPFFAGGR